MLAGAAGGVDKVTEIEGPGWTSIVNVSAAWPMGGAVEDVCSQFVRLRNA